MAQNRPDIRNQELLKPNSSEQSRGSARWAGAVAGGFLGIIAGTGTAIAIQEPVALLALPVGTALGTGWGYIYGRLIESFLPKPDFKH